MEPIETYQEVVCGLLVRNHRILVALRHDEGEMGAVWEFPGGKVEAGEHHVAALERESREELGVEVKVGALAWDLVWPRAGKMPLRLWFYFTALKDPSATPEPLASQALAWLHIDEMKSRPFCHGDAPMIAALESGALTLPDS